MAIILVAVIVVCYVAYLAFLFRMFSAKPPSDGIKVNDYVIWVSQGVIQWEGPRRVNDSRKIF